MPRSSAPATPTRSRSKSLSRSRTSGSGGKMKGSGRKIVTASPAGGMGTPQSAGQRRRSESSVPSSRSRSRSLSRSRGTTSTRSRQMTTPQGHLHVSIHRHGREPSESGSVTSSSLTGRETRDPPKTSTRKGSFIRDSSPARSAYSASSRGGKDTPRKDRYLSSKRAVDDLSKYINDDKRLAKLSACCSEFDHFDENKHNMELLYGAANVLALVMGLTDDDDEIRLVCSALEMVFRASTPSVYSAFDRVGGTIVPWLLRTLQQCETGRMKNPDESILNITKTLISFSRVPELRFVLAQHHGMLDALTRISTSMLNIEARIARMKLTSNLANCDENKAIIAKHDGLLESVLRVAALDMSEPAREHASAVLSDLAACPENQVTMCQSDKLLGTLVKLAVVESTPEARETAITALQNLAYCQENRKRLATYGSGVVLEALKKTLSSDPNDKARRRAAGALTNLVCEDSAERMGNHKGLLEALAVISSRDENAEVQNRATMALSKLAASITKDMKCYQTLMDALVVASLSNQGSSSISTVLRVKAREPENRESMARHPGILDTLADICVSVHLPTKVRDNAIRAIMHLTNEDSNRKVMCNQSMLEALLICANLEEETYDEIAEAAMVSLERLATEVSNRPVMARHRGLLVTVAKATERETLMQDEGTHGNRDMLAKPLLMSLLLAM